MEVRSIITKNPWKLYRIILALAILAVTLSTPYVLATGNDAPSGPHFNLNIIGVSNTANFPASCQGGGNVIFVPLVGHANIYLQQGPFYVVDGNGVTAPCQAQFQLPAPTTITGTEAYQVWARVEGIPGGSGKITTCGTDSTGATVCSTGTTISTRQLKQNFKDVTKTLTQVCFLVNGVQTCVDIFSSTFTTYFWSYDNNGNKVLQLRFYPCPCG